MVNFSEAKAACCRIGHVILKTPDCNPVTEIKGCLSWTIELEITLMCTGIYFRIGTLTPIPRAHISMEMCFSFAGSYEIDG